MYAGPRDASGLLGTDPHFCEVLLRRNVNRFRGGLVFKAHRLVYHSRVIKKKKKGVGGTLGSEARLVSRGRRPPREEHLRMDGIQYYGG